MYYARHYLNYGTQTSQDSDYGVGTAMHHIV